jgi:hypothetical protein
LQWLFCQPTLALLNDTENKENDGTVGEAWETRKRVFADATRGKFAFKTTLSEKITSLDMVKKRINMEFFDAKAEGNVTVKSSKSKVVTSFY